MTESTRPVPVTDEKPTPPYGHVVAEGISADDFLAHYEGHYEWARGYVIKMTPVTFEHDKLVGYLRQLIEAYFAHKPIGTVLGDPFVMRLAAVQSQRQPDLQIVLDSNPGDLTDTAMIGPADICIEVVSPGSVKIDYGEKFEEYEQGGVGEYWLIDPIRDEGLFYRLDGTGHYKLHRPDDDGNYVSPVLPPFALHVPTLWQETLPNILEVVDLVQAMFGQKT